MPTLSKRSTGLLCRRHDRRYSLSLTIALLCPLWLLYLLCLLCLSTGVVLAQGVEPKDGEGTGEVVAIALREVAPGSELEWVVGSRAAVVDRVEGADGYPGGVVLYFDYGLSRSGPIQQLAGALVDRVDELLRLGLVEVVVADPDPRTILPSSDRPAMLRQTLERVFVGTVTEDSLEGRRRRFLDALARNPGDAAELANEAIADEVAMLQRQQDVLLLWANERGSPSEPTLLLLVHEGIGTDPLGFYAQHAASTGLERAVAGLPSLEELASTLAARGLVAAPVVLEEAPDGRTRYAPTPDVPIGFRIGLGRGPDRDEGSGADLEELHTPSAAAARSLAERTGGVLLERLDQLPRWLESLRPRSMVWLAMPQPAPPDVLTLEVRGRGGEAIAAPRYAPYPHTPPAVGAARARLAFADELETTELEVTATLRLAGTAAQPNGAEVDIVVDLSSDPDAHASGPWRFTTGVQTLDDETMVRHEVASAAAATPDATEAARAVRHTSALLLPPGAHTVLVVAEDLDSGVWGVGRAELGGTGSAGESGADAPGPGLGGPVLRLLEPQAGNSQGRVMVGTETVAGVDRVDFYLDGKRIARARRPPFEARVQIGESERLAQLVAVAFDRDGTELARDRVVLNEPPSSFWVRITEPRPDARTSGPTAVAAQLRLPAGGRLARLDFYWRDRLLASLTGEPYRADVTLPVRDLGGFLRVEAALTDGRRAEDVLVLRRGFGEEIGVELVELYLVALDRNGTPVHGLDRDDFKVFEEGKEQTVESFQVAGDLPLTVALAIDSSRSLFRRMPAVQSAAIAFLDSLVQGRDRALLVGFGSQPRLVTPPTGNIDRLRDGVRSLQPQGTTAVWRALHSSLEQVESLTGRRALVAFYDGDDEDREASFQRALSLARRTRVPVYLIVMNDGAARTAGRSLASRAFVNRLERIARTGGGKVYYVSTRQDLAPIFAAISEELRSHYLLTYYPILEPGGPLWRPVEVEVLRRGVTARTIEGRGFAP
ncbi:MAG TPA: VWA domain-containing protein [Thermoanaerobaculia bacterium]|nr:VWA domain-containing protein [Thermoanaerobaculia bacterium]